MWPNGTVQQKNEVWSVNMAQVVWGLGLAWPLVICQHLDAVGDLIAQSCVAAIDIAFKVILFAKERS